MLTAYLGVWTIVWVSIQTWSCMWNFIWYVEMSLGYVIGRSRSFIDKVLLAVNSYGFHPDEWSNIPSLIGG